MKKVINYLGLRKAAINLQLDKLPVDVDQYVAEVGAELEEELRQVDQALLVLMEHENLNKQETANSDLGAASCCALLEELQLKLIAMGCLAQEHFNEKAYDVTKMNIDEIRSWIKKKRSQHCS